MPTQGRKRDTKAFREDVQRVKEQVIDHYEQYLRRTPEPTIVTRLDLIESRPKQIRFSASCYG